MPLDVKLALDAQDAINAVAQLGLKLDDMAGGVEALNQATTSFNKNGVQLTSVIKQQIDEFTTLTSVVNRHGQVVRQTYTQNEAAARRAEEAERKRAAAAAAAAEKERQRLENQVTFIESAFNRLGRNITQFGTYRAFNVITDSLHDGVQAAKDFQIQLSLIRTLSQDSQQSFTQFGKQVREVSDKSGIDIKDVGKGFYNVASDQVAKGADIAPFVQKATDLARVTGSELPNALNTLDSILNSYNLTAADATKVSAILFKTIDVGRININELANTFGRVGPLAESLGVDLTEVAATMAITTQKGTKTADAMTLLTNLLNKIEKPTTGAKDFFKSTFGTESGEAAIAAAGGLLPLINKIVEATRTGRAQVSDFFDEIRGRKQFAVFEQSLPEIQKFASELQNTAKITADFQKAVEIRGESPADRLVKEANKLKNTFTVDLGQSIISGAAKALEFVGGLDGIKKAADAVVTAVEAAVAVLVAYTVRAGIAAIANGGLSASFFAAVRGATALTTSLGPLIIALGAAYVAYKAGRDLFEGRRYNDVSFRDVITGNGTEKFSRPNQDNFEQTRQAVAGLRAGGAASTEDQTASLDKLRKNYDSAYGSIIKVIGDAQRANNSLFDDLKDKSKAATEEAKVAFGALGDSIKEKMSDARKNISKATEEIQSSAKKILGFSETIDQLIYNTREKYANDNFGEQKINNTQNRLNALKQKADELAGKALGAPDAEKAAEFKAAYDKVFEEIAQLSAKKFDLVTEHQKNQYEQYLKQNPLEAQKPGSNVFLVDTIPLERQLLDLKKQQAEFSERYAASQQKQIDSSKKIVATEEERFRRVSLAFRDYEKIEVLDKEGQVKSDFRNKEGKFDRSKFEDAIYKEEDAIRKAAGNAGSLDTRIKLELAFNERRKALGKEATAAELAEFLKAEETRTLARKQSTEAEIDQIKKTRVEKLNEQQAYVTGLSTKQEELTGFASLLGNRGGALSKSQAEAIQQYIDRYNRAVVDLRENAKQVGDVLVLDKDRIAEVERRYTQAAEFIAAVRERSKAGQTVELALGEGANRFTIGEAIAGNKKIAEDAIKRSTDLENNAKAQQGKEKDVKDLSSKIQDLDKQFPNIAKNAQDSLKSVDDAFKALATGDGIKTLTDKLKIINDLLPKASNPDAGNKAQSKVGIADYDSTGVVYAAEGGIVGQFPGQPRGVDRYPIWAAAGETIISARTSAMYRPMIAAIMAHRMPQYMADGGVVGGDTTIGDINITVNGATTNNETARIIGNRLERQLKRGNIKLGKA